MYLDNMVKPDEFQYPTLVRLCAAVTPGVIMTPVSSILEASNAGHKNPEPMYKRWMRGLIPRGAREIIFGVGLNQLSDFCEERVPYFENSAIRNAVGSMTAGVISVYLSHVVHNLSTLKLMDPSKTYQQHFQAYVKKSEARVPPAVPASLKKPVMTALSILAPAGVHIRTAQIVGSFIILNGTINAMQKWMTSAGLSKS